MFKSSNFEKILFSSPSISPLKILRTHGYRNKEVIKKKILDAANKAIERLTSSSSPVGYFCIEEIVITLVVKLNSNVEHLLIVAYLMSG